MLIIEVIGDIEQYIRVHEAAHLLVGEILGFKHGYIEFLLQNPYERARTHYSSADGTPDNEIVRALAGMVVQSHLCPETIKQPLLQRLKAFQLFKTSDILDHESEIRNCIVQQGFWGDIEGRFGVLNLVMKMGAKLDQTLSILAERERYLHRVIEEHSVLIKTKVISDDISTWIGNTDAPDLEFGHVPIYTIKYASIALRACSAH